MKKKILGTSDACSMSCLSHRPSESPYHIVDCRIWEHVSQLSVRKYNSRHKFLLTFFTNTLVTVLMYIWKSLYITKVKKSRKPYIVSSILPKNERKIPILSIFFLKIYPGYVVIFFKDWGHHNLLIKIF